MKSLIAGHIKIKNKQLENLKVNISSQISGAFNDSISKLLNKELNEIFENTLNIENETFSRSTWNLTLKEILLELEILTYDLQPTTCINLVDCLQFYIDLMKDMVQLETKINLSNVTEKIQSWKDNILHLILAYPDIKQSEKLITATADSIIEVNPAQHFCGNPPILKILLSDTILMREGGTLYLKIEVLYKEHSYKIIWKRNNYILQGYNTAILNKTVTTVDEGYYSCEITNKFGISTCGHVFVKVFQDIKFLTEPKDTVGYLYSRKNLYLTCAVERITSDGVFAWFFRRFPAPKTEKKLLPVSEPYIEINQETASSSGFYSCQYDTKLSNAISREAVVSVLKTTVAVERIRVKMILSKLNLSSDQNRSQDNETEIKYQLANLMEVKFEVISIENVSNEENGNERITLTLYGKNLTLYLQNYSWNDLLDKILAERRILLLKSALVHFHANNSKN